MKQIQTHATLDKDKKRFQVEETYNDHLFWPEFGSISDEVVGHHCPEAGVEHAKVLIF